MVTDYQVCGSITVVPIYWQHAPTLSIHFDDVCLHNGSLTSKTTIKFQSQHQAGPHQIKLQFTGKTTQDSKPDQGLDLAVCLESIDFFGISNPKFLDLGQYRPLYPEPWASQQQQSGQLLLPVVTGARYLGWNGVWWLDFDVPVFTWIHQVLDLGCLYGKNG